MKGDLEWRDRGDSQQNNQTVNVFVNDKPKTQAQEVADGMQACGCLILCLPILFIGLIVLYSFLKSMLGG